MPSPPACKPKVAGDGKPAREGPWKGPHLGILEAQKSGCLHAQTIKLGVSPDLSILVRGIDGEKGLLRLRLAAPVEVRIGIKDLESAHEEDQKRQGIDPVS